MTISSDANKIRKTPYLFLRNLVLIEFIFAALPLLASLILPVQPSTSPAYFRHQDKENFYIRAGNASQPLPVSKATYYIRNRF